MNDTCRKRHRRTYLLYDIFDNIFNHAEQLIVILYSQFTVSSWLHWLQAKKLGTSSLALIDCSAHPLAREGRLQLVLLGFQLVREGRLPQRMQTALHMATYNFALAWYAHPPMYVLK